MKKKIITSHFNTKLSEWESKSKQPRVGQKLDGKPTDFVQEEYKKSDEIQESDNREITLSLLPKKEPLAVTTVNAAFTPQAEEAQPSRETSLSQPHEQLKAEHKEEENQEDNESTIQLSVSGPFTLLTFPITKSNNRNAYSSQKSPSEVSSAKINVIPKDNDIAPASSEVTQEENKKNSIKVAVAPQQETIKQQNKTVSSKDDVQEEDRHPSNIDKDKIGTKPAISVNNHEPKDKEEKACKAEITEQVKQESSYTSGLEASNTNTKKSEFESLSSKERDAIAHNASIQHAENYSTEDKRRVESEKSNLSDIEQELEYREEAPVTENISTEKNEGEESSEEGENESSIQFSDEISDTIPSEVPTSTVEREVPENTEQLVNSQAEKTTSYDDKHSVEESEEVEVPRQRETIETYASAEKPKETEVLQETDNEAITAKKKDNEKPLSTIRTSLDEELGKGFPAQNQQATPPCKEEYIDYPFLISPEEEAKFLAIRAQRTAGNGEEQEVIEQSIDNFTKQIKKELSGNGNP